MAYQKLAQALNDSVKMYTPDVLYPRECLIVNVNENNTLKIKVNIGENIYLDEVRYIGIPKIYTTGLFIPLNNNYDEGYCICYNETTESLTENVIINEYGQSATEEVNEVKESEEETSEEETSEESENTVNINYDRRYAKLNHTHTENIGTIDDLKTLIKNTKEGNTLSLDKNFKNERYGNIIINKKITIDGNGHTIDNISFTCDTNEIELNDLIFLNITTNRVNGGVLQLNGQRISINNCIFYNNSINGTTVYEGGVISVNNSSVGTKITDYHFINNFCSNNGGAIRWVGNNGTLLNCSFIGNVATYNGGAIKWLGTDGFIRNCLFKDNKATNGKDILTSDNELLCIGNVFLNDDTIIGTERVYDYITEFDKEEIEHQIYSSFGRNLLPNTKHMILANRNITVQYADEIFRNNKVVYFDDETVSSSGYRDWFYDISVGEFDYDDEFTLSFWVKSTENVFDKVKVYFDGGTNYTKVKVIDTNGYDYVDEFNDGKTSFEIDIDWKKCYVTWKMNSTGNLNVYKRLIIRIYDGVEVFLSSPKLERGNVYTDWTPNPNDNLYDRIPINVSASNPNIDLNDYIESGVYYQPNNTNSQHVTNKPTNDNLAFSLFVEKQTDNGVKQTFTYYDYPKTSRMFVRIKHYGTNNWTKWERIQFTGMNEGGANLLNIGSYYQSGGNEVQDGIIHNGHKSVYINNLDKTSSQYTHIHWTLPNGFHNYNEIYTLSFWAKCSDDNSVDKYITTYFGGQSGYVTVKRIDSNSTVNTTQSSFNDGATNFKLSKEWQHFYVVYQLNSSGDLTPKKQPIIRVWGESEAYISSPKLERGYNVSDWTPSVLNAEPIYPNMDLNDFTMKGEYRCPLTAWATKIENVPKNCQVAFNLKVEPTTDNGCIQTFSSYLPYKTLIFKRSMYNGDWSNWDMDITEPYICSVTDENYGTGTNGFGKLFKIHINNTYYNSPISFEINQRGLYRPIKCYLKFNSQNTKNPTIEYFTYDGTTKDIYICNEEEEYYTIYVRKTETNDSIEIKNFNFNEKYSTIPQRARIYAINEQVSSVPYKSSSNYNSGNNDKKATNVINIQQNNNTIFNGSITANSIIRRNGTSSQFLKGNGSVDTSGRLINSDEQNKVSLLHYRNKVDFFDNKTIGPATGNVIKYDFNEFFGDEDYILTFTIRIYGIKGSIYFGNGISNDSGTVDDSNQYNYNYEGDGYWIFDRTNIPISLPSNMYGLGVVLEYNPDTQFLNIFGVIREQPIPYFDIPVQIKKENNKWVTYIDTHVVLRQENQTNVHIEIQPNSPKIEILNIKKSYITREELDIIDMIYPVGSIYMSVNNTDPSVLFGGKWERIQDRFLLASGTTYTNGSTGGEATHTLTINEMPSHRHSRITQPQGYAEQDTRKNDIISPASGSANEVTKYSNYTGGGQAHNNMPPYLAVYMWKRIG